MNKQRKGLLVVASLFGLVFVAGAIFLVTRLDPDKLGQKLKGQISKTYDLELQINGEIEFSFFPPGASFTEILVRDGDWELLTAQRVWARVALLPLFHREIRLTSLTLDDPVWSIRPGQKVLFPWQEAQRAGSRSGYPEISIKNGRILYLKKDSGAKAELTGLNLKLKDPAWDEAGHVTLKGDIRADRLRIGRLDISDLSGSLDGKGQTYRIEALRGNLFGTDATGMLEIGLQGSEPTWSGEIIAEGLSLGKLCQALAGETLFEGQANLRVTMSQAGSGSDFDSLDGRITMSGKNITQYGFNLDRSISKFRASRNIFNAVDIGLYAFAGPVGLLVGAGLDVANMAWNINSGDRQIIEEFSFDWQVEGGEARTQDVALRTQNNRLALNGAVDLSTQHYNDMTLGLLNDKGCAEFTETISGSLTQPVLNKSAMLSTLANSLLDVFRQGWEIIDPTDCQPFYEGSVAHPEAAKAD